MRPSIRFSALLFLIAAPALPLPSPALYFVAGFDGGGTALDVGPGSSVVDVGLSHARVPSSAAEPAVGNAGGSLKVNFATGSTGFLVLDLGAPLNLAAHGALSFWVRGAAGGERFQVSLRRASPPAEPGFRPDVRNFLPGGVTTGWQKVVVPLRALMADFVVNTSTALSDVNAVVLTVDGATPTETFYLDDVLFHAKAAPVWAENFDDGAEPGAFGFFSGAFVNGGTGVLANAYDGAGGMRIDWTPGTSSQEAVSQVILDGNRNFASAVDVSGCDALSLRLKSTAPGARLGVGLSDDNFGEKIHPSTVTLSGTFQTVTLPLGQFGLATTTNVAQVQLWFNNPGSFRGPPILDRTTQTVTLDDVRFLDTAAPAAPSSLTDDGAPVANGHFFGTSNAVGFHCSILADAPGGDPTLESVRFEHDGLTGGAAWTTVYRATGPSSALQSFTWDTAALPAGTTYQVRVVAMDVAGNLSTPLLATGIEINHCDVASASDATPPVPAHAPVTDGIAGQALPVPLTVTDETRVAGATLFYRVAGSTAYAQAPYPFSGACSSSYTGAALIPGTAVTLAGVEYYVSATDSRNTVLVGGPSAPFSVAVRATSNQSAVGNAGGTVSLDAGGPGLRVTSVEIPPGALSGPLQISIGERDAGQVPAGAGGASPAAAFEFGPSGTVFNRPVKLVLAYRDDDGDGFVEDAGSGAPTSVREKDLRAFYFNGVSWRDVGGAVDPAANTVTAYTRHFSTYALFPAASISAAAVRPAEKIITPGGSPGVNDLLNFGGNPAGAKIEIYDVSGRLVRRLEGQTSWDGRDGEGRTVESGFYLYRAEVEGQAVSGTVTVAR